MTYYVKTPFTRDVFETESLDEANAKLAEIKIALLEKEMFRFTVAREIVNGNDTTWMNADLDNDPEDSHYYVFNQDTGQHELVTSLSAAKARRLELIEIFAEQQGLNGPPSEVQPFVQPISTGSQNL
jgi:hypothetical protein